MKKFRIAIFASGAGTNADKVIRHFTHHPFVQIAVLVSNNPEAYALERARNLSVPTITFSKDDYLNPLFLPELLERQKITHIVLAGFLWLLPDYLIKAYPNKIVNIHPALLPKFGGKGMYGLKVHQAVKDAGEKETGITIHLVNERYDEGQVLYQTRCPVNPNHTAAEIAVRVQQLEYEHYPKVIEKWILSGKINF